MSILTVRLLYLLIHTKKPYYSRAENKNMAGLFCRGCKNVIHT